MFEIVNGHTHTHTDTRTPARVLSYKLTLWAFGSGELNTKSFQIGINNNNNRNVTKMPSHSILYKKPFIHAYTPITHDRDYNLNKTRTKALCITAVRHIAETYFRGHVTTILVNTSQWPQNKTYKKSVCLLSTTNKNKHDTIRAAKWSSPESCLSRKSSNSRSHYLEVTLCLDFGFTGCQDYFIHFEPSQSLGGAKTGDPQKNHLQAELGLSHMWPKIGTNPQRWDDERFSALKISGLNCSAMGAAMVNLCNTL